MSIKTASKYIPEHIIEQAYEELKGSDLLVFTIFQKTAIRLGELEQYVEEAFNNLEADYINLTPQKKNNQRILPNILNDPELASVATQISLKGKAIQKRVRGWGYGFSPHDLRATFITLALEKDVNPIKLMSLTGHKDMKSLMKYNRLATENSLWMYDYILSPTYEWHTTDDVHQLKQEAAHLSKKNAKLIQKNKRLMSKLRKRK